jgi:hypothetical protein
MTLDEAIEELHSLIFKERERYNYHRSGQTQPDFAAAEQKVRDLQRVSASAQVYRETVESKMNKMG